MGGDLNVENSVINTLWWEGLEGGGRQREGRSKSVTKSEERLKKGEREAARNGQ